MQSSSVLRKMSITLFSYANWDNKKYYVISGDGWLLKFGIMPLRDKFCGISGTMLKSVNVPLFGSKPAGFLREPDDFIATLPGLALSMSRSKKALMATRNQRMAKQRNGLRSRIGTLRIR